MDVEKGDRIILFYAKNESRGSLITNHHFHFNSRVSCTDTVGFLGAAHLHCAGESRGGRHPAVPPAGRLQCRPLDPQLVQEGGRTGSRAASVHQVHQRPERDVRLWRRSR